MQCFEIGQWNIHLTGYELRSNPTISRIGTDVGLGSRIVCTQFQNCDVMILLRDHGSIYHAGLDTVARVQTSIALQEVFRINRNRINASMARLWVLQVIHTRSHHVTNE
jgi:hypothetical protein